MTKPMTHLTRHTHPRTQHHPSRHVDVVSSERLITLLHSHLGQVKEPLQLLHDEGPPLTPTVKPHSPHLQPTGNK